MPKTTYHQLLNETITNEQREDRVQRLIVSVPAPSDRRILRALITGPYLRDYQMEAVVKVPLYYATQQTKPAGISFATGIGKGRLIISIAITHVLQGLKVLIIQPNLELREKCWEDYEDFRHALANDPNNPILDLGSRFKFCFLGARIQGSAQSNDTDEEDRSFVYDLENVRHRAKVRESNILVTNYHHLDKLAKDANEAQKDPSWELAFKPDIILVDEAQLTQAPTYVNFMKIFPDSMKVFVSATLFRHDEKSLGCNIICERDLKWAMQNNIVKNILVKNVVINDCTVELSEVLDGEIKDPKTIKLEADEEGLFGLNDPWVKKALCSVPVYFHIASETIKLVQENRRRTNFSVKHQFIATAINKEQARVICELLRCRNYFTLQDSAHGRKRAVKVDYVSYSKSEEENKAVLQKLRNGELDGVVHVYKLVLGYSNNNISVCSFFAPLRSLVMTYQILGRVLRRLPEAEDNHAYAVVAKPFNMGPLFKELGIDRSEDVVIEDDDDDDGAVGERQEEAEQTVPVTGTLNPSNKRSSSSSNRETNIDENALRPSKHACITDLRVSGIETTTLDGSNRLMSLVPAEVNVMAMLANVAPRRERVRNARLQNMIESQVSRTMRDVAEAAAETIAQRSMELIERRIDENQNRSDGDVASS